MVFYFNATLITLLISGIACFAIGLISLIRGYVKKNKIKIGKGWRLTILGIVMTAVFTPVLISAINQEMESGEDFLSSGFFIIFFFFPLALVAIFVCFFFFLIIGITSLQNGFAKNEEGKRDTESIVLGFLMLVLGIVITFSIVMYIGSVLTYIGDSIREAGERRNSRLASSSSQESIQALRNYLFSVLYK